jgi:YVTN family beta-propeller protein
VAAVYDSENGLVYVPSRQPDSGTTGPQVSVLDGTTVVGTVGLGPPLPPGVTNGEVAAFPVTAVFDAEDSEVYVPNADSHNMSVIYWTQLLGSFEVGGGFQGGSAGVPVAAYDARTEEVVLANGLSGNLSLYGGFSGREFLGNVSVGGSPTTTTYDPVNGDVYVTSGNTDAVSVVGTNPRDPFETVDLLGQLNVSAVPTSATVDTRNGDVYVPAVSNATGAGSVSVINGTTLVGSVGVGREPAYAAYDSADGYVYVTDYGSGTVTVLNGTTVVGTLTVGEGPMFLAYDPGNSLLYVSNHDGGSVSLIYGTTVIATVRVGSDPMGPVWDAATGQVYVPNWGSDNVSVLSGGNSVTFHERGLPNGTAWAVNFDGETASGTGPLTFPGTPNGTHPFAVAPVPGYNATPSNGSLTIQGPGSTLSVAFQPLPPAPRNATTPSAATLFGVPTEEAYALIGGIAVVFVVGVALGTFWKRRRTPPPGSAKPRS